MKLLFDQNISFRLVKRLQSEFEGCLHVSDCGLNGSEDPEIWKYAKENDFAIVTFDSDFYDISLINGHPPKIVWIRTGNLGTVEIAHLLTNNKKVIDSFLNNIDFKELACLELDR